MSEIKLVIYKVVDLYGMVDFYRVWSDGKRFYLRAVHSGDVGAFITETYETLHDAVKSIPDQASWMK